jgi:DNA modification methylase
MLKFLQTVLLTVMISILKRHKFAEETYELPDIEAMMVSISAEGIITHPIIDDENNILSGARVVEACRRLGWTEIPVRQVKGLSDNDKMKLIIEANRQRVKSKMEIIRETEFYFKINPKHQGKQDPENSTDNTDSGSVPAEDCYTEAAVAIGAKMSGPTLRRLMKVHEFEQANPEAKLKLIDTIDKGNMSINEAFGLTKQYPKAANDPGDGADPVPYVDTDPDNDNFKVHLKSSDDMSGEIKTSSMPLIITSVPYWDVRSYGKGKSKIPELGREKEYSDYLTNMANHLKEAYRVLSPYGSFFLNIGDTYSKDRNNLISIRLLLAACDEIGFHLVNEIIWKKKSGLPQTTKKRLQPSYEKVYHLVKSVEEYYYKDFKYRPAGKTIKTQKIVRRNKNGGTDKAKFHLSKATKKFQDFLDEQEVSDIIYSASAASDSQKLHQLDPNVDHPAIYPEVLPVLPILTCSRPGDIILDIFSGSATTGVVAIKLGRKYIGYEIQERFVKLSNQRLSEVHKNISPEDIAHFQKMVDSDNTIDIANLAENEDESIAA